MPFEARSMDFSPDGKYLAASSLINDSESDLQIRIWDWRTREIYRTLKLSHDSNSIESKEGIKWSPDGRFLAACTRTMAKDIIQIWNIDRGEIVKNIKDSGVGGCNSISFTGSGETLILAIDRINSGGDSLVFYNTKNWEKNWGTPISEFFGPSTLSISMDGETALIGGVTAVPNGMDMPEGITNGQTFFLYSIKNRRIIKKVNVRGTFIESVAISPDASQVAIGELFDAGGTENVPEVLSIFDASTGKILAVEKANEFARLAAMKYTPDGRYLMISEIDDYIQLLDAKKLTVLWRLKADASSLAATSDSKYMAAGGDGKIIIWQLQ